MKAVTGTTIKLTRNGGGSDDGTGDNIYKSGFFEFEDNIPNWCHIDSQTAIKYEWNIHKLAWDKSYITVKIAENTFSRGSLRVSYYCLNLAENGNGNGVDNGNNSKRFGHKSFDLTSLARHASDGHTPKSLKSPSSLSTNGHGHGHIHLNVNKSDKIAIGLHSKSNINLRAVLHQNLAQQAGLSPFNKDKEKSKSKSNSNNEHDTKIESMSVPAEVALGRHHHQQQQHGLSGDISPPIPDNIPFQFYSPSLPGIKYKYKCCFCCYSISISILIIFFRISCTRKSYMYCTNDITINRSGGRKDRFESKSDRSSRSRSGSTL